MPNFKVRKPCFICGINMKIFRDRRDVCSYPCYKQLIAKNMAELSAPKECAWCKGIFYAKKINEKFCSGKCKLANVKTISLFSIFERDKFKCIYCGKSSIEDGIKLHVEHIKAISCKGISELNNLITSCGLCNNSKGMNELDLDVKERILAVLLERNKNLTAYQLSELEKEIEFYKKHDNDRWMKISFKRRYIVEKSA